MQLRGRMLAYYEHCPESHPRHCEDKYMKRSFSYSAKSLGAKQLKHRGSKGKELELRYRNLCKCGVDLAAYL